MHAVLLDACVLFPNALRDTILTIAERQLFRPIWSEAILEEVRRNLIAKRNVDSTRLDRTFALMAKAFKGAMVEGWKPLVHSLQLNDPDDRHVLAAAITGKAETIATFNLRDFSDQELQAYGIQAIHPQDFLLDLFDLSPSAVMHALVAQTQRCKKPPMDLDGLLTRLDRCGVSSFTEEIRRAVL